MVYTHSVRYSDPVAVRFHCPACGERDVEGHAWTEQQLTRLLGLVLVLDERMYWVQGACCERQLLSRVAPKVLTGISADEIEAEAPLRDRVSPVKIALLVGAIIFAVVPFVGPLFLAATWWPNGSSRIWFRLTCRVVLILHVLAMNLFALLAFMPPDK